MLRKTAAAALLAFFTVSQAEAVTIGPAQTRNERERAQTQSSKQGREAVLKSFLESDFSQSERLAARLLERLPASDPSRDEIAYLRALSLMKLGLFAEARPVLKQLESEGASDGLRAQAAYSLGDSFYFEQKRAEADIYYKEAVRKYPRHGEAEQVKRLLGLAHQPPAPPPAVPALQQAGIEEAAIYSVQVGAFARRRNAERLLNKLLRNRYDAYIQQEKASDNFRVRVGHLSGLEEAKSLESSLKKDGYPTKIFP